MKPKKHLSKYKSKELAEAIVFPVTLTPVPKNEASEQLAGARKKGQQELSDNDRLSLKIFQLKFQLEDYIK